MGSSVRDRDWDWDGRGWERELRVERLLDGGELLEKWSSESEFEPDQMELEDKEERAELSVDGGRRGPLWLLLRRPWLLLCGLG